MLDSKALTEKQIEVMQLVCAHYQSKEGVRMLGITARSVDQRIDSVRRKLGAQMRIEAARRFEELTNTPYPLTGELSRVPETDISRHPPERSTELLRFSDVATDISQTTKTWMELPKLRPLDLGKRSRLMLIVALAILLIILTTIRLVLVETLEVAIQ